MDLKTIPVTTFIVTSLPFTASAQGAIGGAEDRGAAGELAAAPVGAVVEAHSVRPVEERLRFREYVACKHHP
jgi:hypothetical protein